MTHVVVRLMGGLGNQLFQYAAGKAQAKRLGVPLLLDRQFLDDRSAHLTHTLRDFELNAYPIAAGIADAALVNRYRRVTDQPLFRRLHRYLPGVFPDRRFAEKAPRYQPEMEHLKAPVYLDGFWQCERYFLSVADELRQHDLVPVQQPSAQNAELLRQLKSAPSVSLHVRRTDYVTNADANRFHGICSIDYYERAAAHLAATTGAQQFFVFSDDPQWVRENIRLPYPTTFISHNQGASSYWDLFLMQHCNHHIIANSSFSWWGAWLNASPQKVVIAPARWFADPAAAETDIVPQAWLRF